MPSQRLMRSFLFLWLATGAALVFFILIHGPLTREQLRVTFSSRAR